MIINFISPSSNFFSASRFFSRSTSDVSIIIYNPGYVLEINTDSSLGRPRLLGLHKGENIATSVSGSLLLETHRSQLEVALWCWFKYRYVWIQSIFTATLVKGNMNTRWVTLQQISNTYRTPTNDIPPFKYISVKNLKFLGKKTKIEHT